MKEQTTNIKAKIDLFNNGRCFTKGNTYIVPRRITNQYQLMNVTTENDLGEKHCIGLWYKEFEIIEE